MDLVTLTLSEAARQIATRALSPVDLTRAYLDRIEQVDPALRCFITLRTDRALEAAKTAEVEIAEGHYRGALHGIPLAIKDCIETAGVLTTAGSKHLESYVPPNNAFVIQQLNAAGAVKLGKVNMHEWALGVLSDNPYYGICRNPWDTDRTPGGSSGGSAAALAASLCLGSLGTDTRGSIRTPAALCGIVGLKPTYGRVSRRGILPSGSSLDHVGPMARTVRDVALLLQTVAGYDAEDPFSVDTPVPDYLGELDEGVADWRVGVLHDDYFTAAADAILAAVDAAASVFERLGAQVTRVDNADLGKAGNISRTISAVESLTYHHEFLERQPTAYSDELRQRFTSAGRITAVEYAYARERQLQLRRQLEQFFENYDILLTPMTPFTAPRYDSADDITYARRNMNNFASPFNLTGFPAVSVPCGFDAQGLPIGLQLVAPIWNEANLLRAAHAYAHATDWHQRRPTLSV